jgi:predicted  nucleic acid-binding Zn-ribbon protein
MGVSLPDLPFAHSDDNINLGDKDSVRRRALWALEGKPDLAFSKVEIPDITSPDMIKSFELPTKPPFPSGSSGINNLTGKRDSFGKMFASTSASKDQLGTLLEEEEEEEDSQALDEAVEEPKKIPQAAKTSSRPRPASLNLRPLSLVRGCVASSAAGSLPTPTLTPGPRGLRPLALTSSPDAFSTNVANTTSNHSNFTTRQVIVTPSSNRSSYSFGDDAPSPCNFGTKRRSSISYKRSIASTPRDMMVLPSPEMTPIEHRFSGSSVESTPVEQPLTAAEQHFLFRSHNVLLARITELERTLRNRSSRSRPVSYASDASAASSEPSDEMLQLISDLKAERDELKRDVDGWRQRVANADKQVDVLAKRIEAERMDAWVARSRLGLLEVEKASLEKNSREKASALNQSMAENAALARERDGMQHEIMKLNARLKDADAAVDECMRLRTALEQERARREELERLLDDAGLLNTPALHHTTHAPGKRPPFAVRPTSIRPRVLGFQSIDSESSATDVESMDDSFTKAELTLDAVAEEDSELSEDDDDDDGLAGYEDEDDSDLSFSSPGGSSIGSGDELDIQSNILPTADEAVQYLNSSPVPKKPTHASRSSISKTWTFPRGNTAPAVQQADEVDRFFGCLDDVDSPPLSSEEVRKAMFSFTFASAVDEEEMPPFVLPCDVGVVVESSSLRSLDIVPEEAEEEEEEEEGDADDEDEELVGEQVDGGIRFTFQIPPIICVTPPPEIRVTPPEICTTLTPVGHAPNNSVTRKPVPVYEPFEDNEDGRLPFMFSQAKVQPKLVDPVTPPAASSSSMFHSGSRPANRQAASPSSIPRATSLRSFSSRTSPTSSTPSKSTSVRFTAPTGYSNLASITPPSKGPSFIPQPVASPTLARHSMPAKARMTVPSLHLKQGQSGATNGSTFKPQLKFSTNARKMSAPRRR